MYSYTGDYIQHQKEGFYPFTYYTFTPRPLNDAELFKTDDELNNLLSDTYHKLGLLEGMLLYSPNNTSFCELMLLKECTYSMSIDYNARYFSETLYKRGTDKGGIKELDNLISAYSMATDLAFSNNSYSKICNAALSGNDLRESISIRNFQIFLDRGITNAREYNPTDPNAVLPSLAEMNSYLKNSKENILIKAALAHYQFEMIHPFEKYNGIVGRILVFMILQKMIGKSVQGLSISEQLFFHKNEYFNMLSSTQYSGGYIRWIKYFIQVINDAIQNSIALLTEYENAIRLDEKRLRGIKPQTTSLRRTYEYFKSFPITSISVAANNLNMSFNSVSTALSTLQKCGIIRQQDSAVRNRVWEYYNLAFLYSLPNGRVDQYNHKLNRI